RFAVAQSLGDVPPSLPIGQRQQHTGVLAYRFHLARDPLSELRQPPIRRWIRTREQSDKANSRAALQQLSRKLERDRPSGTVAGDHVRIVRSIGQNLGGEVSGQILDARQGLAVTISTLRLQSEERLILPQMLREQTVAEDVAVVSRHPENWRARAARLQRHDGPPSQRDRLGRMEEFHDI